MHTTLVWLAAMRAVGAVENSVADGLMEEPTRFELFDMVWEEVWGEEPEACYELGGALVRVLCIRAVEDSELWDEL